MASSLEFLCFFLLLTTLSSQIHARDSQFFSKVTRNRDPATTTTTTTTTNTNTNNNNKAFKETEFVPLSSFKQQDQVEEEEDPTFLPETEGSGYGFYGHETGLDPPSTTTPTTPTTTTTTTNNIHDHEMNYAKELKGLKEYNNNDNNNYYFDNNNNNKVVDQGKYLPTYEKQGMSDTRFMENGGAGYYGGAEKQEITDFPESTTPKFLGNSKYYSTYGGAGYNGGVQRQGMSDTRFMENGKYFYDVNAEINNNNNNNNNKYYNPNNYNNNNEYNSNNKYYNPNNYHHNNNGYNNNYNNEYMVKSNGYYGNYKENNYGDFYNNNNNNGYKNNQVPEEEEFDFDP